MSVPTSMLMLGAPTSMLNRHALPRAPNQPQTVPWAADCGPQRLPDVPWAADKLCRGPQTEQILTVIAGVIKAKTSSAAHGADSADGDTSTRRSPAHGADSAQSAAHGADSALIKLEVCPLQQGRHLSALEPKGT
jgi:hypothetical protein